MHRNFGLNKPSDFQRHSPTWPMWAVALVAVGVINAVTFLHR